MKNFLQEAIDNIEGSGHSIKDVDWVGTRNGDLVNTWEGFTKIAKNIDYSTGFYDNAQINEDLVIVFSDESWLEREISYCSEQFRFVKKPVVQTDAKILEHYDIY